MAKQTAPEVETNGAPTTYSFTRTFSEGKGDKREVVATIDIEFPLYGTPEYEGLFENEEAARVFHISAMKGAYAAAIRSHLEANPGDYVGAAAALDNFQIAAPVRKVGTRKTQRTLTADTAAAIQDQYGLDADRLAELMSLMNIETTVAE